MAESLPRLLTRPAHGTAPGPFRRSIRRRAWRLLHRWRPRLFYGTLSLAGPPSGMTRKSPASISGTFSRHGPGLINGTLNGGLAHNHRCGPVLSAGHLSLTGPPVPRKRQARTRAVRSQTVARLAAGHPAGARAGTGVGAGCKREGVGCRLQVAVPRTCAKGLAQVREPGLAQAPRACGPPGLLRTPRNVGGGAWWGRVSLRSPRPTGRPRLLLAVTLSADLTRRAWAGRLVSVRLASLASPPQNRPAQAHAFEAF